MATATWTRRLLQHPRAAPRVEEPDTERPFWEVVLLLYGGIFVLAVILTTICFLSAWLVAGKPY